MVTQDPLDIAVDAIAREYVTKTESRLHEQIGIEPLRCGDAPALLSLDDRKALVRAGIALVSTAGAGNADA